MDYRTNMNLRNAHIVGVKDLTGYVDTQEDYIQLTIGEPNYNTDDTIKQAAIAALLANDTHYPPALGYESVRQAISTHEADKHQLHYNVDEIMITQGSTEGLASVLFTLLNPGDEVIIPIPAYPVYRSLVEMAGAQVVAVDTSDNQFQLDAEALESAITEKTKLLLLTAPNNPTGTLFDHATSEKIKQLALKHDLLLVLDEIYTQILYTDYYSLAQDRELHDRIIVVQSLSKIYAMTGWRLGYVMAPAALIDEFLKWHHNVVTGVTSFIQHSIIPALELDTRPIVDDYRNRRDYIYERLVAMGFDVLKPDGAFYIFPSIKRFNMDSVTFCQRAALEGKVMFVPGAPFGSDDYVRISFCYSMETIAEGMDRLENFISTL